jgi:hypothetical protein
MILASQANSQRISAGFQFGMTLNETVDLKDEILFSNYSYNVFYTLNTEDHSRYRMWMGGFQLGGYLQLDYKRYLLGVELNSATRTYFANMKYAIKNDFAFLTDPGHVKFEITQQNLEIPVFAGIKLFETSNNIILYGGGIYTMVGSNKEEGMLNLDTDPTVAAFLGLNEMLDIMYNDENYWRSMVGMGIKIRNSLISTRYTKRIDTDKNHIHADVWGWSVHWNYIITFQKLKKGHYIYTK